MNFIMVSITRAYKSLLALYRFCLEEKKTAYKNKLNYMLENERMIKKDTLAVC